MTAELTEIWRYPIKAHGRERVASVILAAGGTIPYDRLWAVAHDQSAADGSSWASCHNFSIGSKAAPLGAIRAKLDETSELITLSHPDRNDLTIHPERDSDALIAWAGPMVPENRAQSSRVVRARADAFTDSDFPSVTLCSFASHRAVEAEVGQQLSTARWRGNLWIEGFEAWAEFDWIGREVRIGEAILRPSERTDRCLATHANPETGIRDVDVLAALDHFGHRDFSVRAEVIQGGRIAEGDAVTLL